MDRIVGEKCLTIYVHDVLEQRDGEGGREEERPKIREEGKKLREYNFTEEKEDRI